MRSILFTLALAMAIPVVSSGAALADGHSCNQLRNTVRNAVPSTTRHLPYNALNCAGISEIFLLISNQSHSTRFVTQRIEAVFRRENLIR